MNNPVLDITPWQLGIAFLFILLAQGGSLLFRLGLKKDLFLGAVRTFAQLFIMGYVLTLVFRMENLPLTLTIFLIMLITSTHLIYSRVKEKSIPYILPMFLSMLLSYSLVTVMVTGVIINAKPWWEPQYFIPIAGMIVGNSMNALSISLERLFADLRSKRDLVEMKLTLGATYKEASQEMVRDAIRAGMIPSINSMMGVGLVFLPGMMTGQILAGADPMLAIRYQIVVMFMLVASTALASIVVILLTRKKCFGPGDQLLLPHS